MFDDAGDADWASPADATRPRKVRRRQGDAGHRRRSRGADGTGSRPSAQREQWVTRQPTLLVYLRMIQRRRPIAMAEVDARSTTLVESLDSHGVEDQGGAGQTVGPTVTRYEARTGIGRPRWPG